MQCWDFKAEKYWDQNIHFKVCACMRAQQRKTQLTADEEWARCYLTWQSMDRAIWVSCYGSAEELMNHVSDATQWRKGLQSMPLVFWDHVPVWIKVIGSAKVVWSQNDKNNAAERKRASRQVKKLCSDYSKIAMAQVEDQDAVQ